MTISHKQVVSITNRPSISDAMFHHLVRDPIDFHPVFCYVKNLMCALTTRNSRHKIQHRVHAAEQANCSLTAGCEVNLNDIIYIPPIPTDVIRRGDILGLVAYMLEQRLGHRIVFRGSGESLVNEYILTTSGAIYANKEIGFDPKSDRIQLTMVVGQPATRRLDARTEGAVYRYFQVDCAHHGWATGGPIYAMLASRLGSNSRSGSSSASSMSSPSAHSPPIPTTDARANDVTVRLLSDEVDAQVVDAQAVDAQAVDAQVVEVATTVVDAIAAQIARCAENANTPWAADQTTIDRILRENGVVMLQVELFRLACPRAFLSDGRYPRLVEQVGRRLTGRLGLWCRVLSLPVAGTAMNCVLCLELIPSE